MQVPEHIIQKHIFSISDERLNMLARLFVYHKFKEVYGWRFCDFVYKYERGIYDDDFPHTYVEAGDVT